MQYAEFTYSDGFTSGKTALPVRFYKLYRVTSVRENQGILKSRSQIRGKSKFLEKKSGNFILEKIREFRCGIYLLLFRFYRNFRSRLRRSHTKDYLTFGLAPSALQY